MEYRLEGGGGGGVIYNNIEIRIIYWKMNIKWNKKKWVYR